MTVCQRGPEWLKDQTSRKTCLVCLKYDSKLPFDRNWSQRSVVTHGQVIVASRQQMEKLEQWLFWILCVNQMQLILVPQTICYYRNQVNCMQALVAQFVCIWILLLMYYQPEPAVSTVCMYLNTITDTSTGPNQLSGGGSSEALRHYCPRRLVIAGSS